MKNKTKGIILGLIVAISLVAMFLNQPIKTKKEIRYNETHKEEDVHMIMDDAIKSYKNDNSKVYSVYYDENKSKEINAEIQKLESLANAMYNYECIIIDSLRNGIRLYQACAHKVQDVRIKAGNQNVFIAISKGNYAEFTACFANGVRLNDYTPDGYSPVTWAVKEGANDMVQFFMDHEADMFALDQRGYNAFHTAVENGYKDICQLLLDREPDLAKTLTADGENYRVLANKSNFIEWLNHRI